MNKKVLSMLSVVFLLVGMLYQYMSSPIYVYADGTSLVSYALSWVDNPNVPYVYGGGRSAGSLEALAQDPSTGTDCSGFVHYVYAHFGISVPAGSSLLYKSAQQVFYDQSMAVPGDVCWWNGHVAIYIGDNKVVHTHTSRAGHNLIHVEDLAYYGAPSAYLRMVDLGSVSGGSVGDLSGSGLPSEVQQAFGSSEETEEEAANAVPSYGTLVTESDLTGMPIKSSLLKEQNRLNLKSKYDLTDEDRENLAYIQECLIAQKVDAQTWYSRLSILLGLMVITYGVLVGVAYIFDYNNNFIDVSLLGLLSMGRWRILDRYDSSNYSFNGGSSYSDGGVCYLTPMGVALRVSVILGIGLFLISGCISEIIYKFLMWYKF